tara:strand:+ start:1290 stop:1601 length:312 start_codon:yes stop_codon:yes gene_type:complete
MSVEYIIKPEWAFMMDEDFICPDKIIIDGELHDVVSYGLVHEWSGYCKYETQCYTDGCMEHGDIYPENTYAIFTKYMCVIPCVACGSMTLHKWGHALEEARRK